MLMEAIKKIKDEMEKANNLYVQVVGEFLLQQLEINQGATEKVLQEGKSIGKSLNEIKKVAKAKQVNGCAMLSDQEVFDGVLKYFGIEGDIKSTPIAPTVKEDTTQTNKAPVNIDFDVKLEDFI